jgi:ketosteroid isomerase-like protein
MKTAGLAGVMLAMTGYGAMAADAGVEAPIRLINAAFNRGDAKTAATFQLPSMSIIDEIAPYLWIGPGASARWQADYDAYTKAHGITEEKMVLGAVKREFVSGDTAYVIIVATDDFKRKGVHMRATGQLTYALKKTPAGWKIAAQSWAGPDPAPVK